MITKKFLFFNFVFFFVAISLVAQDKPRSLLLALNQQLKEKHYAIENFSGKLFIEKYLDALCSQIIPLEYVLNNDQVSVYYNKELHLTQDVNELKNIETNFLFLEKINDGLMQWAKEEKNKDLLMKSRFFSLKSALKTLDPHTSIYSPEESVEFIRRTTGKKKSIGIEVHQSADGFLIKEITFDSPAFHAGLQRGDVLLTLDKTNIAGYSLREVETILKADADEIQVSVERNFSEQLTFVVPKVLEEDNAIEFSLINDEVAFIKIKRFSKGCFASFKNTLEKQKLNQALSFLDGKWKKIKASKGFEIQSFVFDLRGNPGGVLEEAVSFCEYFLKEGAPIVQVKSAGGKTLQSFQASKSGDTKTPVMILIDERSASAAEIMASSLQRHRRALIIGARSYGKGTVQEAEVISALSDMPSDAKIITKITVAEYFTADDFPIQNRGVTPQIWVKKMIINQNQIKRLIPESKREQDRTHSLLSKDPLQRLDQVVLKEIRFVEDIKADPTIPSYFDNHVICAYRLLEGDGPFENEDWKSHEFYTRKRDLCEQIDVEQQEDFRLRMNEFSMNWTSGGEFGKNLKPQLVLKNINDEMVFQQKEKVELSISVQNQSNIPAFRVWAKLYLEKEPMLHQEVYWGKVDSKAVIDKKINLIIFGKSRIGVHDLVVEVYDENHLLQVKKMMVCLQPPEKMNLEIKYQLKEKDVEITNEQHAYEFICRLINKGETPSTLNQIQITPLVTSLEAMVISPHEEKNIPLNPNEEMEVSFQVKKMQKDLETPLKLVWQDFSTDFQVMCHLPTLEKALSKDWVKMSSVIPVKWTTPQKCGAFYCYQQILEGTFWEGHSPKSFWVFSGKNKLGYFRGDKLAEDRKFTIKIPKDINHLHFYYENQEGVILRELVAIYSPDH